MKRKIAICMPVEGPTETARVHLAPQLAYRKIGGISVYGEMAEVVRLDELHGTIEWAHTLHGNTDVVRARDRMARMVLWETDATDILWWDEDVLPDDLGVIARMLESGHPVVGAPYRRKNPQETYAYRSRREDGTPVDWLQQSDLKESLVGIENDCVEVEGLAFGFMVTSRAALQRMWDAYHADRWYFDAMNGKRYETVSLFDLQYTPTIPGPDGMPYRVKLSEDYSFCQSWRALGGRVMMYVGQGSPVGHIGNVNFRGRPLLREE